MSYVVSIRRAESQPPFAREELVRVAQAHEGLVLGQGVLTWSSGKGGNVELGVEARELRADRIPEGVSEQALGMFRVLARELNARVVGEEGEDLTSGELSLPSRGPWSTLLGGLVRLLYCHSRCCWRWCGCPGFCGR